MIPDDSLIAGVLVFFALLGGERVDNKEEYEESLKQLKEKEEKKKPKSKKKKKPVAPPPDAVPVTAI